MSWVESGRVRKCSKFCMSGRVGPGGFQSARVGPGHPHPNRSAESYPAGKGRWYFFAVIFTHLRLRRGNVSKETDEYTVERPRQGRHYWPL